MYYPFSFDHLYISTYNSNVLSRVYVTVYSEEAFGVAVVGLHDRQDGAEVGHGRQDRHRALHGRRQLGADSTNLEFGQKLFHLFIF
jgi:peptidoglycan/xylan/chitin deacetylase (PgdA/CDA1 family)